MSPGGEKMLGVVLVFRAGVTKEQADAALKTLTPLLDTPWLDQSTVGVLPWNEVKGVPFNVVAFDPYYGFPVWYVP